MSPLYTLVRHSLVAIIAVVVAIQSARFSNGQGAAALQRDTLQLQENLQTENLVAWCIVPFDASKRGPRERAEMLKELGLRRLAYDWREEHVNSWDEEWSTLQEHEIELTAFWCSSSLDPVNDPGTSRIIEFLSRNQVQTQLWIMLPDQRLAEIANEDARVAAAAKAIRDLANHVEPLGCTVGLYNHGGWIGRPDVLVRVIRAVGKEQNVGIVYNFHHAHDDLGDFPDALREMKPYLLCLNLNGTTAAGPKILPLGSGQLDSQILEWIREVGYNGPIGILDHRNELDAKESLSLNLTGLERLLESSE